MTPVSNYLFNKLKRDGLINYEVVISFRGGTVLCSGCGQGE